MAQGIDVSKWQGVIDWQTVKKSGKVDFAIIKAGGSDAGFYQDAYFERNYAECKKHGIPVGAYYFVGNRFWTVEDGVADAKRFLKQLQGKQFELPIYLDIEAQNTAYRRGITEAAQAFCNYLELQKAFVGIYGSEYSTFEEMVYKEDLRQYSWWIANYSRQPRENFLIWQKSSKGVIAGISGNVDLNTADTNKLEAVKNAIKKKGLNKWK